MNENPNEILKHVDAPSTTPDNETGVDHAPKVENGPQFLDLTEIELSSPVEISKPTPDSGALTPEQILQAGNLATSHEPQPLATEQQKIETLNGIFHDGTDGGAMLEEIERAQEGL